MSTRQIVSDVPRSETPADASHLIQYLRLGERVTNKFGANNLTLNPEIERKKHYFGPHISATKHLDRWFAEHFAGLSLFDNLIGVKC
jgi:hypothetical protein